LLSPFVVARLDYDAHERTKGVDAELARDAEVFSADPVSLIAQPTRSSVLVPRPRFVEDSIARLPDVTSALELTLFPGVVLLVGSVLFVSRRSRLRLPLVLAGLVFLVLALGPSLRVGYDFLWHDGTVPREFLPYRLLLSIPGLSALRGPIRTVYILVPVLGAATAIGLDRALAKRQRRDVVVVAAGCVAVLALNLLVPLPTITMGTTPGSEAAMRAMHRVARARDGVISVPADCDPTFEAYQVFHETRIVGCAGSFAANPWRAKMTPYGRSVALAKLRCDRSHYGRLRTHVDPHAPFDRADIEQLRREFGVRFVIVDRRKVVDFACPGLREAIDVLDGYRSLGGDGRLTVIDLAHRRR
jgi:hypothetical protein